MNATYKLDATHNDRTVFHIRNVPHLRETFDELLNMAHDFILNGHRVTIHSSRDGIVFDSQNCPV